MADEAAIWKKEIVDDLTHLIETHPTIAIINIRGIPCVQLQKMRSKFATKGEMRVAKLNLIQLALKNASKGKPHLMDLDQHVQGQAALVATKMNPFMLYKEVEATKQRAPARGGEIAPDDIEVKAGDTPFKPGPIVGEFGKAGIPAAIEKGKVVIKKDKKVVEKGKPIPREVAIMLAKLEIFPLTVGLDLFAAYEDGMVYLPGVLKIDEAKFLSDIGLASRSAMAVAIEAGYYTPETIRPIISKSVRETLAVLLESGYPAKGKMDFLLGRAYAQMLAVANAAPDALDDELKGKVAGAGAPASASAPQAKGGDKPKKDDDEEEEKVSEEEAAAGLGALFG